MSFPPCKGCGATYAPGAIGTVHAPECPELTESKTKKANILALYEVMKTNTPMLEAIDLKVFAREAAKVGLYYHPVLGLMDQAMWEQIKPFIREEK